MYYEYVKNEIDKNNNFLGFYYVDKAYADYLRDPKVGDRHIPVTDYGNGEKFFIGAVLCVNGIKYFAPVSSYTGENSATFPICDKGKHISSVRLNYMFPVLDDTITWLDITNIQKTSYRDLVQNEYWYCNKHKSEIYDLAEQMYDLRKNGKRMTDDKMYINDFSKLEIAAKNYKEYVATRIVTQDEQAQLIENYHITPKDCDDLAKHADRLKMPIKKVLFTIASFDRNRFSEETRRIIDAEIASKRKKPRLNQGNKTQEKNNDKQPATTKPKKKDTDYNCR